jgi:cytidylate kinase
VTVIAMTREIGSRGTDVAAGVATELGLEIINSEIVASNAAGSLGVEPGIVQRYLDGTASIFERWQIDKRKLSRFTSEQIFRLAQQDNVLIRGWGAGALFRDIPQVISVRVCAPIELHERAMMDRLGIKNVEDIREEIERFDAAHESTMRASFNISRGDALLYHVVLNTGRVPIDACVNVVCQLAWDPRFQDNAATQSALADKLLETRVRAILVERIGIEMASITVSAVDGRIVFDGCNQQRNFARKGRETGTRH